MRDALRRHLFSKAFFAVLMVVMLIDIVADVAEHFNPDRYEFLNAIAIGFDSIAFLLALWMYVDLSRRRRSSGNDTRRG